MVLSFAGQWFPSQQPSPSGTGLPRLSIKGGPATGIPPTGSDSWQETLSQRDVERHAERKA
jgi:hypothetical protein